MLFIFLFLNIFMPFSFVEKGIFYELLHNQKKDHEMETKHVDKKAPCCPVCESRNYVISIMYGKPTKELLEQWKKKEIELGGSLMMDNVHPQWTCTRCKIFIYASKDALQQEPASQNPA